ncbi:MSCRAMM family protein [Glycomyces terrestris]|uniref:Alpha-amylase n=1 Tax=Glycomyces terrestris TaxID=2493553 RepID=A0A426V367_9ACTN|nr:carboxypeptidase regulatory-like domain-containing protein [Glycomyces terrestris]RRS01312.1 hypothetical protein EIW28_00575 [Glycomyces terrestris]
MFARGLTVTVFMLVALALGQAPPAAAQAQTSAGAWADWSDWGGSSGAYTGAVTIGTAPGLQASFTTDSRSGSGVGEISGSSTWLSEGTPVGAKYGSSRGEPYLNLRPAADNAASPSTTTYRFDGPTPVGFFAFVLGDIDADAVRIEAEDVDGDAVTAAEIGFQGAFNYCSSEAPGGPSCSNVDDESPTWDASAMTLTGRADAADRSGASAWFEPTVPLSELTFVFTRRSGFPVYQTWFASMACDLTGTVTDENTGAGVAGATVNLFDAAGAKLESAQTDATGAYAFPAYTMGTEYDLEVIAPDGMIVEGARRTTTDLSTCPSAVDFTVRDIEPVAVGGSVATECGIPLGGVPVTLTAADGTEVATTTDSEGRYLFDRAEIGEHTITATPPEQTEQALTRTIEVESADQAPITGQDFVVRDTGLCPDPPGDTPAPGDDGGDDALPQGTGAARPLLPVTGADLPSPAAAAAAALLVGAALLAAARSGRRADRT